MGDSEHSQQTLSKTTSSTDTISLDEFTDDREQCCECGDYLDNWAILIQKGFWNGTEFDGEADSIKNYWCKSCFNQKYTDTATTEHSVESTTRLWNILNASEGSLVADTTPTEFDENALIRVIDDAIQFIMFNPVQKSTSVIEQKPIAIPEFTETDFHETFNPDAYNTAMTVHLRDASTTPFTNWEQLPDGQYTLEMTDSNTAFID